MSSLLGKTDIKKAQIFEAIKILRETSNSEEKCKALTRLQSIMLKSGSLDAMSEIQMRDLCKLVVDAFASDSAPLQEEARCTLVTIFRCLKDRKINLFNKLMHTSMKNRLKIFQAFEVLEDESIKSILRDKYIVDFFKDCLKFISPDTMNWLSPNSCVDDLNKLQAAENKTLTNDEQIEEYVMVCVFDLLHRLYKLSDSSTAAEPSKLNVFFVDKIATLAYMGHKRQRAAAMKVLQLRDIGNYVRSSSPAIWQEFKSMLQNTYCQRMTVLVAACEPDWSLLWTTSVQLLGTDLHRGAGLINNLLSVEEKAFKSVDTVVRKQAFLSWKLIVDNFALDEQELATPRRVKLLCIPLNAKNSKTETMTLTKLDVWWHLIYKLYTHIDRFTNPVLTQFLNFCFGPLGDTPLLSLKFNVIASPGKRFFKTKIVAVDALLQLLTDNEEDLNMVKSSLEERVPGPVSNDVFTECSKNFIHCIGEAIITINQFSHKDFESKSQVTVILWKTLLNRVKAISDETAKVLMYKEIMSLVIELSEHADDKPVITDAMLETILPSLDEFPTNCIFHCETMVSLMGILIKPAILVKITRKYHDLIRNLLYRGIKPPGEVASYISNALEVFRKLVMKLDSIETENVKGSSVLWLVLSDMVTRYMSDQQKINEGDAASHDFTTIQTLIKFPFTLHFAPDIWQMKSIAVAWKSLYGQFNLQANLVPTVKLNECVSWAIDVIQNGIQLDTRCTGFAISCLDGILTTMNYKHVLDENGFLPIIKLINDLCVLNLPHGKSKDTDAVLKALSSVLITLYGHVPTKVTSYLETVKPAIEQMLKPCKDECLVKEIASTWETVMSIFKGLGVLLSPNVIMSYQEAIRLALHHEEAEIVSQTLSCLESEEHNNGPNKDLIQKILKEVDLEKIRNESAKNDDKQASKLPSKVTKFSGSFLNRKTASPRPGIPTDKAKEDKKRPFLPEPESQEYVVIKSDFKFDVSRLTEHQKESLLRRREDIPALYNDMSQSCSQDTQNLQEWFEKRKNEIVGKNSTVNSNGDNAVVSEEQNADVGDADKENKIESDQAPATVSNKEIEVGDKTEKEDPKNGKNLVPRVEILSPTADIDDNSESDQSVAKKLDFESRAEFPDDVSSERKVAETPSTSQNLDNLGEKLARRKEARRGVKRKASGSDSDSEENTLPVRRRRNILNLSDMQSDSDSVKSNENEEVIKPLSKRTKNEMSRLQINMVFDSKRFAALPSRRRSKVVPDGESELGTDDCGSPETTKAIRNRTTHRSKDVDKDAKSGSEQKMKKRNSRKSRTTARDESKPDIKSLDSSQSHADASGAENASSAIPVAQKTTKQDLKCEKGVQDMDLDTAENNSEQSSSYNEDSEEIVESSQASSTTGSTNLDKKYTKKQCFIRIDKMQSIQPGQTIELGVGNEKTKVMKGRDPDSPFKVCTTEVTSADLATKKTTNETETAAEKQVEEKAASSSEERREELEENKSASPPLSVSLPAAEKAEENAPVISEGNSSSPGSRAPQSDVSMSPARLPSSMLNSSSPKNNLKRYSKLKSVTSQGRAAHMLGLVTKQAIAETRSNAPPEDDSSAVNSKRAKETDEEFATGKKERLVVLKEPERLGSPSGSRQEKIFNKMRTTLDNGETVPQTTQSHFSNLKNDGEKASLVKSTEKERTVPEGITNTQNDKSREKTDEDITSIPNHDRESLPMLEWSSANPPSLTASPSASILKRQRQLQLENDPECSTPACKRKRVSFADPPVSMEMGYEITASTPPHRMNKIPSVSRIFFPRKDSPIRLKQTKIKNVQISPWKPESQSDFEIDKSTNIVDHQTDQVIDDSEDSAAKIDVHSGSSVNKSFETENPSSDTVENESDNQTLLSQRSSDSSRVTFDNLSMEIEIAAGSRDLKCRDEGTDVIVIKEVNATEKQKIEETETQKDMFESSGDAPTQHGCDGSSKSQKSESETSEKIKSKNPSDENGLRCVDISILTNPSVEEQLVRTEISATEALEDTVDVQNITGLNSTTNSDDLFSAKPIRTSTQATETAHSSEFDTMTVTDSVFSNLPFSQASQASNDTMELDQPELLDSTKSIFPSLTESCAPIDSVIGYLADPLWKSHLSNYLHSKGIETVGNLARLTEREINWIPVKRSPKVPFVRDVLQHYEKSSVVSLPSLGSTINDSSQTSITTTPNASTGSLPPSSTPITRKLLLFGSMSETGAGNSVNGSVQPPEMVNKSTETQVSLVDLLDEIDASVVLKSAIKRCSAENILANYKLKMKNMADEDLERATIKMLGIESKSNADAHLKTACRTSGLGKVLGRLPDIFSHDKQFFAKVLATYRRKIKVADCMEGLDFEEVKAAICQQCTSSDLAEMLSKKLKDEEETGVTTPMTELSSLQAMLKRMPKDLIISHTVANEELISPLVVLDIALQNNTPADISFALEGQSSAVRNRIFNQLCTIETLSSQIKSRNLSEETLTEILKVISRKMEPAKFLDVFNEVMKEKFISKKKPPPHNT